MNRFLDAAARRAMFVSSRTVRISPGGTSGPALAFQRHNCTVCCRPQRGKTSRRERRHFRGFRLPNILQTVFSTSDSSQCVQIDCARHKQRCRVMAFMQRSTQHDNYPLMKTIMTITLYPQYVFHPVRLRRSNPVARICQSHLQWPSLQRRNTSEHLFIIFIIGEN